MTFIDLIPHRHFQFQPKNTIRETLAPETLTVEFQNYLKKIGFNINDPPILPSDKFDDNRIFDFLYFDNPKFRSDSYFEN
jgi:hypothetical protein